MTREEREEAARIIKECKDKGFKHTFCTLNEYHTALDTAIKALEQEPMRDATPEERVSVDKYIKSISKPTGVDFRNLEQVSCEDAISRQAVKRLLEDRFLELQKRHDDQRYETNYCLNSILELPIVTTQPKTGHWIEVAKYQDGKHKIKCSECESHIFTRGHANSYAVKEKYKYCPRCGARMVEPQAEREE